MALKSKPYYWLICDRCSVSADYGDFSALYDAGQAVEFAEESDWLITASGAHFCDTCWTFDEEGHKINLPPIHANGSGA